MAAAAPFVLGDLPELTSPDATPAALTQAQQAPEPSALAKALAEGIRLRYGDRLTADDLRTITRAIDGRLRGAERLYQAALTNADEPDFVFRVYRGD